MEEVQTFIGLECGGASKLFIRKQESLRTLQTRRIQIYNEGFKKIYRLQEKN